MEKEEFEREFNQIQSKVKKIVRVYGNGFMIYTDRYTINEFSGNLRIVYLYLENVGMCEINLNVITGVC